MYFVCDGSAGGRPRCRGSACRSSVLRVPCCVGGTCRLVPAANTSADWLLQSSSL